MEYASILSSLFPTAPKVNFSIWVNRRNSRLCSGSSSVTFTRLTCGNDIIDPGGTVDLVAGLPHVKLENQKKKVPKSENDQKVFRKIRKKSESFFQCKKVDRSALIN